MIKRSHFLLPLALLALWGCAPEPAWNGTNVSGVLPDLEFQLVDSTGKPVTADQYRGRPTLLFFGFTNCPGPCPTTLSRIGVALDQMPAPAEAVQVLLVTVDPDRDTPEALAEYSQSFGPWLHGLTGTPAALESVRQAYKVHAQKLLDDGQGQYDVAHSTMVLAFDRQGRCRLLFSGMVEPDLLAADLTRLVAEDA